MRINFQIWVCRAIIACHPERSRNAAESKDLLSHKEILRLRASPFAQDDGVREPDKQQFVSYFNSTTVTPPSPSPYRPIRKEAMRLSPRRNCQSAFLSAPVPLPWMR